MKQGDFVVVLTEGEQDQSSNTADSSTVPNDQQQSGDNSSEKQTSGDLDSNTNSNSTQTNGNSTTEQSEEMHECIETCNYKCNSE